jgi:peptidyl-dipeptidase Dcp
MDRSADPKGPDSPLANPFFADWSSPFGAPPFAEIKPEHFAPAFTWTMREHAAEVEVIAGQADKPTFANTVEALERSGRALERVADVFHALTTAHTSDALQKLEREISPRLAAHHNAISQNERLFGRLDALYRQRDQLALTPEQQRVLERYHLQFRRAGAHLAGEAKARLAAITERLAALGTAFSQNLLADEQECAVVLDGEADLAGLPDFVRVAARASADERRMRGKHVITLQRSSVEPFLQFSSRRDLREKAFRAWTARGDHGGTTDNKASIAEMVALRAERARLLDFPSFAHYRLDDSMAKRPEAVAKLLDEVWTHARARALADRDALQALVREEGGNFELAPWDWRYYAEKLRRRRHDIDEAAIKPYLQLDRMIEAAFAAAQRLFGLAFTRRKDIPVWHRDVRAWEVTGADGRHVGVFFGDYFARPSKRSGAWMTALRRQHKVNGETRPLIVNVMNFSKAPAGKPTLLSFDDARTLFHEFGHALHGLLSDVTYPLVSGTNVLRDFVELPSQLFEHWLEQPEVLREFARHAETGQSMPDNLIWRLVNARTFNQGFATVEYVASALVDLALHSQADSAGFDPAAFEKESLQRIGMPEEIVMRHRLPHFTHLFSGGGYAAAYYSYMWSEVLDADAFGAFEATGNIFDPAVADRLRQNIYAAGGARDPAEAYVAFRGRLPTPEALLRRRGFVEAPAGEA